jgi:hypothetical protein
MAQAERDVREDSDQLLSELEKLKSLESQKRTESFSSPPFHALADEVERQAHHVFEVAVREERDGDRTVPSELSIDNVEGADTHVDPGERGLQGQQSAERG